MGFVRDSIAGLAQACRWRARRADSTRVRIVVFQSALVLGRVNFADDDLDHSVKEVFLVGDVLVQRHGDDMELFGQPPHAERTDAYGVGQRSPR